MVEKRSIAEFFSKMPNPYGPIKTPEIIKPMIPGIFIFFNNIGDNKMISNTNENISTGLCSGSSNSEIK